MVEKGEKVTGTLPKGGLEKKKKRGGSVCSLGGVKTRREEKKLPEVNATETCLGGNLVTLSSLTPISGGAPPVEKKVLGGRP